MSNPPINYEALRMLTSIKGLSSDGKKMSSAEAHAEFMENYRSMFVAPQRLQHLPPKHIEDRKISKNSTLKAIASTESSTETKESEEDAKVDHRFNHNINENLVAIRPEPRKVEEKTTMKKHLASIRKIIHISPLQRTAKDNEQLLKHLLSFPYLADQVTEDVLRELTVISHLENWQEPDISIFGNTGLYLILRGSLLPTSYPFTREISESEDYIIEEAEMASEHKVAFSTPGVDLQRNRPLKPGEFLGTLKRMENPEYTAQYLTAITIGDDVELLKIPSNDYARIVHQTGQRDHVDKIALLQENAAYKLWSRQPLLKVASIIDWRNYPPNTVLASEGYRAPFVAYLRMGECVVLRQVNAKKSGKSRQVQVVMAHMGRGESFGELSLLDEEPMSCTIVTECAVQLAVILPQRLKELDEDTQMLLRQSSGRTFGDLTQEEIDAEYMRQESLREWKETKHNVLMEVINAKGIRPGFGKWAQN